MDSELGPVTRAEIAEKRLAEFEQTMPELADSQAIGMPYSSEEEIVSTKVVVEIRKSDGTRRWEYIPVETSFDRVNRETVWRPTN